MTHTPPEIEDLFDRYQYGFDKTVDTPISWYPHILKCHQELVAVDRLYTIAQIKQKFDGLRFYISASDPQLSPRLQEIVRKYEEESLTWG
jgi:hypothetical protein